MARPITQVFRTKHNGAVGLEKWSMLGQRFIRCADPEGIEIPKEAGESCIIDPDFPKLTAEVWNSVVSLYIHFMESDDTRDLIARQVTVDNGLEVAVFFTKDIETGLVQAWVPTQAISMASVEIDYEQPICDLRTGIVVEGGVPALPDSVVKIGTSHSHNTMFAGFSGTDDKHEKGQPGMHIVVGRFEKKEDGLWHHQIAPSIVMGGERYRKVMMPDPEKPGEVVYVTMHHEHLIDYNVKADRTWNRKCLELITLDRSSFSRVVPASSSHFSLADSSDYTDYFKYRGYRDILDRHEVEWQCALNGCSGDVTYTGYCDTCDQYYEEADRRSSFSKDEDASAEPIYNPNGKLVGYRTAFKMTNGNISYAYSYSSHKLARFKKRFEWEDTGPPSNMPGGKQKNKKKRQSLSSHSAILDKEVDRVVASALTRNQILCATEGQDRLVSYELKELAKILTFMSRASNDPNGPLVEACCDIFRNVLGGAAFTEDQTQAMGDVLAQYGLDLQDLEEQV